METFSHSPINTPIRNRLDCRKNPTRSGLQLAQSELRGRIPKGSNFHLRRDLAVKDYLLAFTSSRDYIHDQFAPWLVCVSVPVGIVGFPADSSSIRTKKY